MIYSIKKLLFPVVILFVNIILVAANLSATSAQDELAEPILVNDKEAGHTKAFFGTAINGDIFNTAGSLGSTFRTGTIGPGKMYFLGDIFTWINTSHSEFKPRRVIYTLEPGYYYISGDNLYRFFIKHQSFHDVDFTDNINESYELYGLSYMLLKNPEYYIRAGKYLNRKDVDYNWDFAGSITYYLDESSKQGMYLHFWLHNVSEKDSIYGRNGFTDYAFEIGYQITKGPVIFARYEFMHDLDRINGRSDHLILMGPKYIF